MDPKEKKVKEEELNVEETLNNAEEQPQDEQAENAAPMTHEEELEKELETAQETIEEQKDKYLRLSAEFDNYRKRTMKEKAELILNGGEKSLSSILPVVDDFERAIKTMETATDVQAVEEEPRTDKECCRPGRSGDYSCFQVLCHVAFVSYLPGVRGTFYGKFRLRSPLGAGRIRQ